MTLKRRWRRMFARTRAADAGTTAASMIGQADALRDAGRFALAAEAYARALTHMPGRHDLLVQLGNMHKDAGAYAQAVAAYDKALAREPNDADAHLQRGRALKLAGRRSQAIEALKRAVEIAPDFAPAVDELHRLAPGLGASGPVRGVVDAPVGPVVSGWAFDARAVEVPALVDIALDGTAYLRVEATLERGDLREIAPGLAGGGFAFVLPDSGEEGEREADVHVTVDGQTLPGGRFRARLQARPRPEAYPVHAAATRGVSIIVPVHGAARETAACLDALLAHTGAGAEILVIDDASPGGDVAAVLARFKNRAATLGRAARMIRNAANLGYTATVNRGLDECAGRDVVLLNSDAQVGPGWLPALRAAAYSAPDVASATPLSDNAGAFTAPEPDVPSLWPAGVSPLDAQRLARRVGAGHWPETPTGSGFCFYMRADALAAVGTFDALAFPRGYGEENDWCMRAARAGWRHVVDDRTLVLHARSASFREARRALAEAGRATVDARYPDYGVRVQAMAQTPGLADARRRLRAALAAPAQTLKPRVLFVVSTQTGGTPLTNRDLMIATNHALEPWLLSCDAREMTLTRVSPEGDRVVARRRLREPLALTPHRSREYEETLWRWLLRHAIDLVHVRHLAWHSLALPAIAASLDIPVVASFHDFYAVCPTVKLLDETLTHCAGVCTATPGDCVPDLWRAVAHPPLKHRFVHEWRRRFAEAMAPCAAFVTTSATARDLLVATLPGAGAKRFEVIPHGRDFPAPPPPAPPPSGGPLDVVAPGNISPAKGRDALAAIAAQDGGARLRLHLLGDVDPPLKGPGLVDHGRYPREAFLERCAATGARLGLVLSLWPETWCHTLTEMWAAGLPVVVFDFGAQAERVRAAGAGWIVPQPTAQAALALLLRLADDPAEIAAKAEKARLWRDGEGRALTAALMSERYLRLYREIAPGAGFAEADKPSGGKDGDALPSRRGSVRSGVRTHNQ